MITKEEILKVIDSNKLQYFDRYSLAELMNKDPDEVIPVIRVLSRSGAIQKVGRIYVSDWGYARRPGYVSCYIRRLQPCSKIVE